MARLFDPEQTVPTVAESRDLIECMRYKEIIEDLFEPAPPLEPYKFPNDEYYNEGKSDHMFCAITKTFGYCSSMKATSTAQECPGVQGKTMRVYLKINNFEAYILIDTGSTIDTVSPDFTKFAGLKPFPLSSPITLQLGCSGLQLKVNYGVWLPIPIGSAMYNFYFDVASLDHYDLIIGTQIMQDVGMVLNFRNYTIHIGSTTLHALEGEGDGPTKRQTQRNCILGDRQVQRHLTALSSQMNLEIVTIETVND
ncbi:uncharacterized protein PHACADRAFT_202215 [Phanerochaete carnosa HHB-10118-sp]|uniref:Peptidase A2 domain-containing protein n=1 Tax=Phanerochaete carnosa (strain HHB-10118-sp) TaxID=650164 RepID=K5WFH7_PHACS|nr:uncharacterized protein PHACADRAFT_202215 [Phanerochaete carnosa HHB-10118-sp]EKM48932.1 hypothetical protein PHACADRAFT_202215 [Phanerochaete carnosa HHB-10118-sp]